MAQDKTETEPKVLLSDEEVRRRIRNNSATRARAKELAEQVRNGTTPRGPSLSGQELADFLREQREKLERPSE
jgi:hypothetical protein